VQIQFATMRVDGGYEAALIVDGKFKRSGTSKSVTDLFVKLVGPILAVNQEDGTEIAVNVALLTAAESARIETRARREAQASEAEAEATEIERLTAAVKREKEARQAALIETQTVQG